MFFHYVSKEVCLSIGKRFKEFIIRVIDCTCSLFFSPKNFAIFHIFLQKLKCENVGVLGYYGKFYFGLKTDYMAAIKAGSGELVICVGII